jgi:hypothetical protein
MGKRLEMGETKKDQARYLILFASNMFIAVYGDVRMNRLILKNG